MNQSPTQIKHSFYVRAQNLNYWFHNLHIILRNIYKYFVVWIFQGTNGLLVNPKLISRDEREEVKAREGNLWVAVIVKSWVNKQAEAVFRQINDRIILHNDAIITRSTKTQFSLITICE